MLHDSWQPFFKEELNKPYFLELKKFLDAAYRDYEIFPARDFVFRVFSTELEKVKVVILGQDPYHTPGMADGLAFSILAGNRRLPPSLINIYKEIDADIGSHVETGGSLLGWQEQGVLLLNNVLTVEAHKAGSHRGKGWEIFTEAVIKYLNENRENLVFILWGRDAREKKKLIDSKRHLVLESAHPSPLSAYHGFFGSKPFSKTNEYLERHGKSPIVW
jgi:uracil-DNA glycosylase